MAKSAPRQTRDVGEMGEAAFRGWCQRQGLSVQQSKPDRMGWDLLVEFEPEVVATIARDRQHTLKTAFVQVKSSDHASNSVRAKLSALKRLADKVDPAFILFLEFEGKPDPVRGRLLLIGQNEISAILRRMRVAESEGRLDFQNIDLSLGLGNAVEITPDGSQIDDELYSAIPDDMTMHAAEKQRWRETCGNDHIAGSFTISGEDGPERLVDLFIGKRKSLIVDRFVTKRSRFGISLPSEITEQLDLELAVSTPGREVIVRAWDEHKFVNASMPATFVVPLIANLPDYMKKVRIYNEFIDCTLSFSSEIDFQLSVPADTKFDIAKLARFLRWASLLSLPGSILEVEVKENIRVPLGTPELNLKLRSWSSIALFVDLISDAMSKQAGAPFMVSMSELHGAFRACEELFIAATQSGSAFRFASEHPLPKGSPSNAQMYFPFWVPLPGLVYQAIVQAPINIQSLSKRRVRFLTAKPSFIEQTVVTEDNFDLERLNKRVDFYCQLSGQSGYAMKPRLKTTD